jgi:hypothetical protein
MKYYERDPNSAFASYFYYFYFVELSQKQANNEQSTILDKDNNKIVKDDYKQFNDTKNGFNIGNRNFGRIVIAIISLYLIFYTLAMVYTNYQFTRKVVSYRSSHINYINNLRANINHNLNNVQHGLQNIHNIIEAGGQ